MCHAAAEAEEAGTHSEEVPEATAVRVHVLIAAAAHPVWDLEAAAVLAAAAAVEAAVGGAVGEDKS